jgi:hypothetical protein
MAQRLLIPVRKPLSFLASRRPGVESKKQSQFFQLAHRANNWREIAVVGVLWTSNYRSLLSPPAIHLLSICFQLTLLISIPGGPGATGISPAASETSNGWHGNDY